MQHAGIASFLLPPFFQLHPPSLSFHLTSSFRKSHPETQPCHCDPLGAFRPCDPRIATQQNHLGEIADHAVFHEAQHQTVSVALGAEVAPHPEADPLLVLAALQEVGDVTGAQVTVALPAQIRVPHRAQR